jgi:hypothetical protein
MANVRHETAEMTATTVTNGCFGRRGRSPNGDFGRGGVSANCYVGHLDPK